MELHGCKGCGSVVVEALLELAGVDYHRHVFDWEDAAGWARLRTVNPLGQVPLLVLDDGTALTETAAIALWIANTWPAAALLPDDPAQRALAYRWTVYFASNVYQPVVIGDFPERWVDGPEAQASLKAHALERLRQAWAIFESSIEPSPFVFGERLGLIDVYLAMFGRWRPGRAWIAEQCPKAASVVRAAEGHPVVARVWSRNFD